MKDWKEWSNYFDNIVKLPTVAPIFKGEIDEVAFNELIDSLFKIANDMNKFVENSRAITDARWA